GLPIYVRKLEFGPAADRADPHEPLAAWTFHLSVEPGRRGAEHSAAGGANATQGRHYVCLQIELRHILSTSRVMNPHGWLVGALHAVAPPRVAVPSPPIIAVPARLSRPFGTTVAFTIRVARPTRLFGGKTCHRR